MNDLEQRLRELGEAVPAPHVPLADDVARGRTRVRRHRLAAAGAALASVVVAAGAWNLAPDLGLAGPQPGPAAPSPSREVVMRTLTEPPCKAPVGCGDDPAGDILVIRAWNAVLADRLDPDRQHLRRVTYPRGNWNVQGGRAFGSTYVWSNPEGPGVLQLSMSETRDVGEIQSPCNFAMTLKGWQQLSCADVADPPAGAWRVRVGQDGDLLSVVVDRKDGQSVALTFDALVGDDSPPPVSGPGPTVDDLVQAALDLRLSMR